MEVIISILVALVVSALVIWIVGKLNLGLSVSGFGSAFIAAIVIALVGGLIYWLLGALGVTIGTGWVAALIYLIVAAIILMISGSFVPGMVVHGFGGALIAALAIAVVTWLVDWLLGAAGIG